jgi:NAD(P)H-hydrate epimerase
MHLINEQWVKEHVIHRSLTGHKKTFGHVLIIAGSEGKAGAAILCAKAALNSGCGMVTALLPKDAVNVLLQQCPEVMYINNPSIEGIDLSTFDAILIGPGIGFSETAKSNLKYILDKYQGPIVLDADALTMVANEKFELKLNHIVTPHPGEFSRLMGIEYHEDERQAQALLFIEKTAAVLVLKGAKTIVGSYANNLMQNTKTMSDSKNLTFTAQKYVLDFIDYKVRMETYTVLALISVTSYDDICLYIDYVFCCTCE